MWRDLFKTPERVNSEDACVSPIVRIAGFVLLLILFIYAYFGKHQTASILAITLVFCFLVFVADLREIPY
jgi:hypothetical protein